MEDLDSLFSVYSNTMSVHLRENIQAMAKHGSPGNWILEEISDEILSREIMEYYIRQIKSYAESSEDTFYEESDDLYQVVQLHKYRIVITHPPFSDAIEITIVRPTLQRNIQDYNLDKIVFNRITSHAEGILIAGAPGHGKSTFGSALVNYYADMSNIVKTIEKPRDLQVDGRVTQFTILPDDVEKVGDLLLLMRPDYVIFDEIRKNHDFQVYADMRLAGVGMVGVIHATQAIDSIQRFVNRIELGLIPSIIDTVIFIKNGDVDTVLSLKMTVKTPRGFTDQSLARPVIEIKDFSSGNPLYEIFSFGEQVVVIPVNTGNKNKNRSRKINPRGLVEQITIRYPDISSRDIEIQKLGRHSVKIGVPDSMIGTIKKDYKLLNSLEREIKASVSIVSNQKDEVPYEIYQNKKYLIIVTDKRFSNSQVDLSVGSQFVIRCIVDSNGEIMLSRKKATTRRLEKLLDKEDYNISIKQS